MSAVSANFILAQLRHGKKKSRGRRFSMDEKVFALSLLKQSPKAYAILKKAFALPSRKVLINFLQRVPFSCGINADILKSLKTAILKMNPMDRYCCLLFDEMTIEASLHYNKKNDVIEGFQNCGDGTEIAFTLPCTCFHSTWNSKKMEAANCLLFWTK